MFGKRGEIREYLRSGRKISLIARLSPLAGEHQHGARAGGGRGLHILARVAHHVHILQRHVEAPRHLEEHAGLGFAAFAAGVGGVWAEEERIDPAAHLRERTLHGVVNREKRARGKEPPRDPGLVGGHHDAIARLVEAGDGLQAALDRTPFSGRLDVVVAVVVDGAVAVEDDELHLASLERSATRFIDSCSSRSKARRLLRSAASSTITITESKNSSTGDLSTAK